MFATRRPLVLALTAVLTLAGALAGTAAPARADSQGYAPTPGCAWQLMSNSQVLNVAFPDTSATYWILPYALGAGDSITLKGTYPKARYFSLNTYGTDFSTIDTLRDNQIRPAAGGNPYTDPAAAAAMGHGKWTATVVNGAANHARNQIRGLPAPGKQSTNIGFLIIRVYVPDAPNSPSGGVNLPNVTMKLGGATIQLPPCAVPFNPANYQGPIAKAMKAAFNQVIAGAAAGSFSNTAQEAVFQNPASTGGLFPNGDNAYIGARLTYRKGRVAVVRGLAPTFPNTRAGASPAQPGTQVRYWSMCNNDKVTPYPVVDCKADFQTALDGAGRYTYVVAAPAEAAKLNGHGYNVLRWGATDVDKVIFLRNMVPSANFGQSIQAAQAQNGPLTSFLGAYYPQTTYCNVDVLLGHGADACY